MRERRLGRWVARISVTFGLGAAVLGGAVVMSAGPAGASPAPAVRPATDTSFGYTSTTTTTQSVYFQIEADGMWW